MSRLIGSEIRYTKLGYWMRQPPYGYVGQKVETAHGKRVVLVPHPDDAPLVREMFRLRASGLHSDREIADKINDMGYRSPRGAKLDERHLWRLVRKPIYAGINSEKWTGGQPVKCAFEGLVSVETFNAANKGRRLIVEHADGRISIVDQKEERHQTEKGARTINFPYRRVILCPECRKPLLGSASKGGNGKYYPAYHCTKGNHNFRISKQKLEELVDQFVQDLRLSPDHLDSLFELVRTSWEKAQTTQKAGLKRLDRQIAKLETEISQAVSKIKLVGSQTAIKYLEADLVRLEAEVGRLQQKRQAAADKKPLDLARLKGRLKHLVEHLGPLFKNQPDPSKKAKLFGLLFDKLPSCADLAGGTNNEALLLMLNPVFSFISPQTSHMVTPRRIELRFPD